ncbi:regulator of G-protein signaling rgs-2 [Eurytemora carolleeae]|uniref:regulator of G-protein signaling rgs-2 n=1 Tax=Eurytemora carolleeae TaxID=1294199 RepID=UPI000C76F1C9|nr:regulator of G-protein signaling rgs-2 [Eurytemora carolleeae]|eukprot:XP_023335310.1 regulator of G-protein signaling rgs-2-like [Eurytemora affinis]
MLSSSPGIRLFLQFLKQEHSDENLMFWIACERLKKVVEEERFKSFVEDIFNKFLTSSSTHEVSLDSRVKEQLNNNRSSPNRDIFDEAQGKIYSLMHRDSYPRFLISPLYNSFKS